MASAALITPVRCSALLNSTKRLERKIVPSMSKTATLFFCGIAQLNNDKRMMNYESGGRNYEIYLRNYETIRKVRKLPVFTMNDISYIRMISYFRMALEIRYWGSEIINVDISDNTPSPARRARFFLILYHKPCRVHPRVHTP